MSELDQNILQQRRIPGFCQVKRRARDITETDHHLEKIQEPNHEEVKDWPQITERDVSWGWSPAVVSIKDPEPVVALRV